MKLNSVLITSILLFFSITFSQNKEDLLVQLKLENLTPQKQVAKLKYFVELNLYTDTIKSNIYNQILFEISKKNNFDYDIGCYYYYEAKKHTSKSKINSKAALYNIRKAKWIFIKTNSFNKYLSVIYMECYTLSKMGKLSEAMKLAHKTIDQFKSTKYHEVGQIYFFLAEEDLKEKQYKDSFKNLKIALNYFKKSKDDFRKAQCVVFMGDMAYGLQKYSESINYFKSVFEKHPVLKSEVLYQIMVNHRLAKSYVKKRDYNNAIKYSDSAIFYLNKVALKAELCEIHIIKADALNSLGNTKMALEQIDRAEQIYKKIKDDSRSILIYLNLVKSYIYYKKGNLTQALYFIKKNLKFKNISITYLQLSNIQRKLKNYKMAYFYLNKFHISKINEINKNKGNVIVELEALYDLNNKELVVQKLKIKNLENELKLDKKNDELTYAIAVSILFLIIIAFGFYIYRTRSKVSQILEYNNTKLENLNELLKKSLVEKELLLKEIHHRVKNNLQLVSSILFIQANDSPDISVPEFLDECQNRISSIALIHQNLYMSDNLDFVNFQIYIEDLTAFILNSVLDNENIRFQISTNNNNFNIQTSISLGLIINELSCNSIKYAFKDKKEGIIFIEINCKGGNSFELIFGDNGCGNTNAKSSKSIGLELVSLLVMQLNGGIVKLEDRIGTFYKINFEEIKN